MPFLKPYIFILFFFIPIIAAAQVSGLDSTRNKYLNEKNDSLKIKYHLKYIYTLTNEGLLNDAGAEITSAKKELAQFTVASFVPVSFFYEGIWNYKRTDYLHTIICVDHCLKTFHGEAERDFDEFNAGKMYILLGLSYCMMNDWENAQLNYQKAITESEKAKDSSVAALAYLDIAYIFLDVGDWSNAEINLKKSAKYLGAGGNKIYPIATYANLAQVYSRLDRLNEAKIYLEKSDSLVRLFPDARGKAVYSIAKGVFALGSKNYKEAYTASVNALDNARRWGDSAFVTYALENLGRTYKALGNYKQAAFFLLQSNKISNKYNYMPQRKVTLKQLFALYKESGQAQKAIETADELFTISDSLAIVQNNNRRIIMDVVFESESKEKKISVLQQEKELQQLLIKQKNTFNYILTGGIFILLIFSLLSYRNYKQQKKLQQLHINELEKNKQLVAVDSMLKGQEDERSRLAKDLHDGLGGLLSGVKFSLSNMKDNLIVTPDNMAVFERSLDMLDTSIKELRRVAHNMMPEMLVKFGLDEALKEYCNSINTTKLIAVKYQSLGMEERIDKSIEIIIYRIIQELLNNIMKHAGATEAFVQLIKEGSRLSVVVEDNGKGFDISVTENNKGAGLESVRSRVDYLKGQLDIHADTGNGTLVNIEFNI